MARALVILFIFALALYCVADVLSSDDHRRGGTPKFLWVIVSCIPVLGGVVWLVFISARKSALQQGAAPSSGSSAPYYGTRATGSRTGAPDDDPEFLWKLAAEQRRKREAEERRAKEQGQSSTDPDSDAPKKPEGDGPNPKPDN